MQDRNEIKWLPFNSVINSNKIISEINKEQKKVHKPILSEDQIKLIDEAIFEAYTNHLEVNILIFKNNNIIKLNGYINDINKDKKGIILNSTPIYFNQILKIITIY